MLNQALPLPWGPKELLEQDPWQFLKASDKMKIEQQNIPFDAKTMCWVPDKREGYTIGEIKERSNDMVTVIVKGEVTKTSNDKHSSVIYLTVALISYLTVMNSFPGCLSCKRI